jgi:hypothetical protein
MRGFTKGYTNALAIYKKARLAKQKKHKIKYRQQKEK